MKNNKNPHRYKHITQTDEAFKVQLIIVIT